MKSTQSAVFNRTGRQRILTECIKFHVDGTELQVTDIRGYWSRDLDPALLQQAMFHLDIRSLLYSVRASAKISDGVLEAAWGGVKVHLDRDLLDQRYRVKLQVSIALPATHAKGGQIMARSEEIVVLEGDAGEGPDDGEGGSLLPTQPAQELDGLCRLDFTHKGPVLRINSSLEGLSWREIATNAFFKYGVFTPCVERVLLHIAMHDEESWMEAWRDLPGVKGTDPEVEDGDDFPTAYRKAKEWAQACAKAVAAARDASAMFLSTRKQQD